jgi:hypothetical protein
VKLLEWWRDPDHRVRFGTILFFGALVGWPVSALTVFKDEPQGILGLSWVAIIIGALEFLATADAHRDQEN